MMNMLDKTYLSYMLFSDLCLLGFRWTDEQVQLKEEMNKTKGNKLGLSWAKLRSSWNWALLQLICIKLIKKNVLLYYAS